MMYQLTQKTPGQYISPFMTMFIEILKQSDSRVPGLNEQVIEDGLQQIAVSSGSMLCPQSSASYTGLGKLIEKDWTQNDDLSFLINDSASPTQLSAACGY